MTKKIVLLLSLLCYNHAIMTSTAKSRNRIADQRTNTEAIGNEIYALLKKRTDIRKQLAQVYEKLPDKDIAPPAKETFSLGYIITSSIFTGIVASPAFTINYLNKYVTPEKYQNFVDKASLGTAKLIGAIGGFKVAKQGAKYMYDFFRYESIRKEIKGLEHELSKTTGNINSIDHRMMLYNIEYINDYSKLYNAFIKFYKNNNNIITKEKLNIFIAAHSDTFFPEYTTYDSIAYILAALRNIKGKLIHNIADPGSGSSSGDSWSTGNWSHDMFLLVGGIVAGIAIFPWLLLASPFIGEGKTEIKSPYGRYKALNEWEYKKYQQVDTIDTIIKKLKIILLEVANEQKSTSP